MNATNTIRENIADNGGLREAFKALKKNQKRLTVLKTVRNYTPEQLFFISFGTVSFPPHLIQ